MAATNQDFELSRSQGPVASVADLKEAICATLKELAPRIGELDVSNPKNLPTVQKYSKLLKRSMRMGRSERAILKDFEDIVSIASHQYVLLRDHEIYDLPISSTYFDSKFLCETRKRVCGAAERYLAKTLFLPN